ncbi:MAG: DUF5989 family protein [candidate division KSB1 bacterium]|nr:DUF5989 family protein [candidate division KSB1 bacterium]
MAKTARAARERLSLLAELWLFLRRRKRLWLAPLLIILILLGLIVVFTESSALAPFIYAIF